MSLYTRQAPGISFSSSYTIKRLVDAIVTIPKTHARGLMLSGLSACEVWGPFIKTKDQVFSIECDKYELFDKHCFEKLEL